MRIEEKRHEKLATIAKAYLPEWNFSESAPDAGSVLAMLVDDMLEESSKRYGEILHKHKIQYLNLFDKLKEEPIESAKSYVRLTPVVGMDEPVHVPKSTRLLASDPESGQEMIFETTHGITTTSAELKAVFSSGKESDRIVRIYGEENGPAEEYSFFAFDIAGENCAEHVLIMTFEHVFDSLDGFEVGLRLSTSDVQYDEKMLEIMGASDVKYSIIEASQEKENAGALSARPFDRVEVRDGIIWLAADGYQPQKTEFMGHLSYVVTIESQELADVQINGAELVFAQSDFPPDNVICSGVDQGSESFRPFGSPMEIYSVCEFECSPVFARKGASIDMDFNLKFELVERRLPELVEEVDYKIVMKKDRIAPKASIPEVKPDYVLIEYLTNGNLWRRIMRDEHTALLFNGSEQGDMKITFQCPEDMADTVNGACRMRLRLTRADNLYTIPSNQYVPVINNLRFSYSYMENPLLPERVCTRNNFELLDITDQLRRHISVPLYYNNEMISRAMYLGFDKNLAGSPLSLYFEIENDQDLPLDYTAEYYSPSGFVPIQTVDNTCGMLYSGTMLMLIPADGVRKTIFDYEGFWIRLVCKNPAAELGQLPIIHGIYTNMARVENVRTLTETFYVDEINGVVKLELAEKNLIAVKVYANEDGGKETGEENWVEWQKRVYLSQQGRFYTADLANGIVTFDRNCFATYPLKEGYAAIRVDYRSYQGAKANVAPGAINTSAESLRFISSIENPIAAYGGYDGYNEETAASLISNMLRTRNRAVSNRDYFDIIKQVSYGVCQIKCVSGIDRMGRPEDDVITIALLIDEYEKGSHIFSAVKDAIRDKLTASSSIIPLGKTLVLSQPHFIKCSVRIWLRCSDVENVYDLQKQTDEDIRHFIDPLKGGFDGKGWPIGVLPTSRQLLAYLKMQRPGIVIDHIAMAARLGNAEYAVDDDIYSRINNPFAMAVNGEHTIYVSAE